MEQEFSFPFLTLQELSDLADRVAGSTTEDCSRRTVDWARTLLAQASLFAGLAGIRLTTPHVGGVYLVWDVGDISYQGSAFSASAGRRQDYRSR